MQPTIYISLGNSAYLGIDKDDRLILFTTKRGVVIDHVDLGIATKERVKELHEYLDHIANHSSKVKP